VHAALATSSNPATIGLDIRPPVRRSGRTRL